MRQEVAVSALSLRHCSRSVRYLLRTRIRQPRFPRGAKRQLIESTGVLPRYSTSTPSSCAVHAAARSISSRRAANAAWAAARWPLATIRETSTAVPASPSSPTVRTRIAISSSTRVKPHFARTIPNHGEGGGSTHTTNHCDGVRIAALFDAVAIHLIEQGSQAHAKPLGRVTAVAG